MDYNKVNLDGNGNIILQDIKGNDITINYNDIKEFSKLQSLANKELLTKIEKLFEQNNINLPRTDYSKHLTLIPYYDYNLLIDRKEIIENINSTILKTHEIIILQGIGGIGKTTLALAFCNNPDITKLFDHIAWISISDNLQAETINTFTNSEVNFKYNENLTQKENFIKCINVLKKINGNNLLIIDNVNNLSDIYENKNILESLRWHTIITSRTKPDNTLIINIEELELAHSKALFQRYYKKTDRNNDILNSLLKQINYHTLLTELLAKTGNKNPILDISKLYNIIKKRKSIKEPLLQKKITISNQQTTQFTKLYDYLDIIFDTVQLNSQELLYLKYFSILASVEILFDDLIYFFQIPDDFLIDFSDILDNLVQKGWLIQNEIIIDNETQLTYKCHQLIQDIVRLKKTHKVNDYKTLILGLNSKIEYNQKQNPILKFKYIGHCKSVISHFKDDNLDIATLSRNLAILLRISGDNELGLNYALKSLNIRIKHLDKNNIDLIDIQNSVGFFYDILNKPKIGYEYKKQAVKNFIDYKNVDFHIVLLNSFASCCNQLEYYDEALNSLLKAKAIIEKEPKRFLQKALTDINISRYEYKLKKFENSLIFALSALDLRKKELEINDPLIAQTNCEISQIYYQLNDKKNALKYSQEALDIYSTIFTKKHPKLIWCKNVYNMILEKGRVGKGDLHP